MRPKCPANRRAFTLIELLVVIAIIGVLMADGAVMFVTDSIDAGDPRLGMIGVAHPGDRAPGSVNCELARCGLITRYGNRPDVTRRDSNASLGLGTELD